MNIETKSQIVFTDVSTKYDLPHLYEMLNGISEIAHQERVIEVQCIGATRNGEVAFLNRGWHQLLGAFSTSRRQFFEIKVDGKELLVRPDNDCFPSLRVTFKS